MIPSVEEILKMLVEGSCSHEQAMAWMEEHFTSAVEQGERQALDRDAVLEEAALYLDNIGWAAEPDRAEKASWCRAAKSVRDLKKKEITNDLPITLTRHSLKGDDLLGYAMCEDPNGKWVPYEQSVALRALKREPSAGASDE